MLPKFHLFSCERSLIARLLGELQGRTPSKSPLFVSQTLGSKRAYTPRLFVDQAHTHKVILLHKVLLREVNGLTPS
jgi:hypothetical protein